MNKKVLLIGRNPHVLAELAAALTDEGYTVQTTNRVEQASQDFNAAEFDGIAFGRGVDDQTNAQLRAAFSAQNEQVIFVDGLAPVIPLLVKQLKIALLGAPARETILTHFSYEQADPSYVHIMVTTDCRLIITLYQLDAIHTTQIETLVSESVTAGEHKFPVAVVLPDGTIRFLAAEVDERELSVVSI